MDKISKQYPSAAVPTWAKRIPPWGSVSEHRAGAKTDCCWEILATFGGALCQGQASTGVVPVTQYHDASSGPCQQGRRVQGRDAGSYHNHVIIVGEINGFIFSQCFTHGLFQNGLFGLLVTIGILIVGLGPRHCALHAADGRALSTSQQDLHQGHQCHEGPGLQSDQEEQYAQDHDFPSHVPALHHEEYDNGRRPRNGRRGISKGRKVALLPSQLYGP
eukprot:scaffold786_cov144-Amphora_coffeaeformis.AAC.2